jgi:hypothetical protein
MVDIKLLSLAMDLRARAQDILVRAETMYDVDAQQTMREIAARCVKFAERVEFDYKSETGVVNGGSTKLVRAGRPDVMARLGAAATE